MADSGIKKVTILNNDLPLVSFDDNDLFYELRYRVVSEDKNRSSHWSKFTKIIVPTTTDADLPYTTIPRITVFNTNVEGGNKAVTATWTFPQDPSEFNPDPYKAELEQRFSQVTFFDIFVRWSPDVSGPNWDPWKYETTISTNTYTILRKTSPYTAKRIDIAVQIPTARKTLDPRLELFEIIHDV
jgi:hypothetical protein